MTKYFVEAIDTVDAAVFSGDAMHTPSNRELLKEHCERWLRNIEEVENQPVWSADDEECFSREAEADIMGGGQGESNG